MMQQHTLIGCHLAQEEEGKDNFVGGSFYMDLSLLHTTCNAYDRCVSDKVFLLSICKWTRANTNRSLVSNFQMEGSK